MAVSDKTLLASLVAPHSTGEFFSRYWPDHYFAVHGDMKRLPQFLQAPELSSFKALASKYNGRVAFGSGAAGPRTVGAQNVDASLLFNMGLSVNLANIASCVTGAETFLRQLEQELGINEGSARISAFASPKDDGLAVHFDAEDVFSVQLHGAKRFHVAPVRELSNPYGMQWAPGCKPADDLYPQVRQGFPKWENATAETVNMQPGSVLFVPRGTWHYTEASQHSFSVSIALRPPTALECILEQLRLVLLQDPQWRKPLYGAWGSGAARQTALEQAQKLLSDLPAITQTLSAQDVTQHTLSPAKRFSLLNSKSRFQKIPTARILLDEIPRQPVMMSVILSDEDTGERTMVRMELPGKLLALIKWLTERETPFSVEELATAFPEIASAEQQRMLEILTRGGFLKLLWFPPLLRSDEQAWDV